MSGHVRGSPILVRKNGLLRRVGYALIAAALIILFLLSSAPYLGSPQAQVLCMFGAALGLVLVLANRGIRLWQVWRQSGRFAYCLRCSWHGPAEDWVKHEGCPECDSEEVRFVV